MADGTNGLKASFAVTGERNAARVGQTMSSAARGVLRLPKGELRLRLWGGKPGGTIYGRPKASLVKVRVYTAPLPETVDAVGDASGAAPSATTALFGGALFGYQGYKAAKGWSEKAGEEDDAFGQWLHDRTLHTTYEFEVPYRNPTEAVLVDVKGQIDGGAAGAEYPHFTIDVPTPCQLMYEVALGDGGASFPIVGDLHFVGDSRVQFVSVSIDERDAIDANRSALARANARVAQLEASVAAAGTECATTAAELAELRDAHAPLRGEVARLAALNNAAHARNAAALASKEEALASSEAQLLSLTTEKLELEARLRTEAIALRRSRSAEHAEELSALKAGLAAAHADLAGVRARVGAKHDEVSALEQRLAAAQSASAGERDALMAELAQGRDALEAARAAEEAAREEEARARAAAHAEALASTEADAERRVEVAEAEAARAKVAVADAAAQSAQREAVLRCEVREAERQMELLASSAQGEVTAKIAIIADKDRQIRVALGERDRDVAAAQQHAARAGREADAVIEVVAALCALPPTAQRSAESFAATKAVVDAKIAALGGSHSAVARSLLELADAIAAQRANAKDQLANEVAGHVLLREETHALVERHRARADELERANIMLHQQSLDGERLGPARLNPLAAASFDRDIATSLIRQVVEQEQRRAGHVAVSGEVHQGTCGYYAEHRLVQHVHLAVFNERVSPSAIESVVRVWCQCADALGARATAGGDRSLGDALEQLHLAVEAHAAAQRAAGSALVAERRPFARAHASVEAAVAEFIAAALPDYLCAATKRVEFAAPRVPASSGPGGRGAFRMRAASATHVDVHANDSAFPVSESDDSRASTKSAGAYLDAIAGQAYSAVRDGDDGFGRLEWLLGVIGCGAASAAPLFPLTCTDVRRG